MPAEIVVLPSARAVAEALADRTAAALRAALAAEPRATLCLTGGSTPVPAYQRLSQAEGLDWDRVHVFWGDERSVPPDHAESNYGMARRTLLRPAGVPESNVHRMPGECPPPEGSRVYEQALEQFFGDDVRFDVLHLGMGSDGHTASLFPGTAALDERGRRVVPNVAPASAAVRDRLTLTLPVLAQAELCLFAVAGAGKRGRVLGRARRLRRPAPGAVGGRAGRPRRRRAWPPEGAWSGSSTASSPRGSPTTRTRVRPSNRASLARPAPCPWKAPRPPSPNRWWPSRPRPSPGSRRRPSRTPGSRASSTPRRSARPDGEPVRVIERGRLNHDSGPDVTGARVQIGGVLWAGDVEVHTTSGAWEAHGHHRDRAYDRVVLHVVLGADRQTGTLRRADGSALPELVLLPHLDRSLRSLLRAFYLTPRRAPHCSPRWDEVDAGLRRDWIRQLGAERLHEKARALGQAYGRRPDLDRLLVVRAFRAMGYEANADVFQTLAERLPLAQLRALDGPAVHAAVLSASGLAGSDLFRKAPDGPPPMRPEAWKRGGRPANAPRLRVAQAAAWLAPGGAVPPRPPSPCWRTPSRRGTRPRSTCCAPSRRTARPGWGRPALPGSWPTPCSQSCSSTPSSARRPGLSAAVDEVFAALPPATDRVTRQFVGAGLRPRSAAEVQGAHQLARAYCDEGRCARCAPSARRSTPSWPGPPVGRRPGRAAREIDADRAGVQLWAGDEVRSFNLD